MNRTQIQITGTIYDFFIIIFKNILLNFILHDPLYRCSSINKQIMQSNHSPNISLWSSILSQVHDDHHSKSIQSTSLHVSIIGRIDTVSTALVEAKTNVNVPDEVGITPLMLSVLFGNTSKFYFLFLLFLFLN